MTFDECGSKQKTTDDLHKLEKNQHWIVHRYNVSPFKRLGTVQKG